MLKNNYKFDSRCCSVYAMVMSQTVGGVFVEVQSFMGWDDMLRRR